MAIYNRYSKGAVPQDPRRKRRPFPPDDYPYEPEVLEAPEELPVTPKLSRPTGPETIKPTPFRSLSQFRQWYTGQSVDVLPGDVLPPSPEWGKDRKSTRLNSSHVSESRMPSSA